MSVDAAFPGADLVQQGLVDLARGEPSSCALLVAIGAPRLRRLGLTLPDALPDHPEHRLYELLARLHGNDAHARYNALIGGLVSYERARESEWGRRLRMGPHRPGVGRRA